ncbi:MAG: alpha/beta hydrolase [Gemmatimonadaceae bacterium]|nr:alpha/beta hydrolase [Gemmatimonadaceae bacterium]
MAIGFNQLSVRERGATKGGDVVPAYDVSGYDTIDGKGRVLLLVHGYNNSVDVALRSFSAFVESLEQLAGRPCLPWSVYGVHWPGDEKNPVVSLFSYSSKIAVSRTSAASLFDYLKARSGPEGTPMSISIVAHSLGSRLTLELAEKFRASAASASGVVLERLVLMAAAVPVFRVEERGSLRAAVRSVRGACVLHSTGDRVLRFAFPPGQTVGKDGFFPTAVGRYGHPERTWQQALPMADHSHGRAKKYGHSSYWPGRESAAAAAAFLGLPVPVVPADRALEEHELPEAYAIEEHVIPERELA